MEKEKIDFVKSKVRNIPDFPIPGIVYKDLSTLFKDSDCVKIVTDGLYELYKDKGVTKVVGLESRGFVFGSILAYKLGAGFVPIRKPGKLPAQTQSVDITKEYGTDTIEIHCDAITSDDVVVIHDDLLATGGTMLGAIKLVSSFNPKKIYINFATCITALNGRDVFPKDIEITSLIDF